MRGAAAALTGLDALRERLRPLPEGPCLMGLSGGADSVGLMHLLLPLRGKNGFQLEAVHVNHGLRGAESDGDEAFARDLCAREGVPFRSVRLELGGRRDENAAREARYKAFEETMRELGLRTLILAHQMDDQAETFLMRLLRGAGPEGLAGMRPEEKRGEYTLLRPMLEISGAEIREALRAAGIPWREDGSNRDPAYFRNRIRLELMPLMESMIPGAAGRIARAAGLIGRENEAMTAEAERLLEACEAPEGLMLQPLEEAPEALRGRVIRRWWRRSVPPREERELSYDQTRRVTALPEAPRGTIENLPGGWRVRREKDRLRLLDPENRTKNNRPGRKKGRTHD